MSNLFSHQFKFGFMGQVKKVMGSTRFQCPPQGLLKKAQEQPLQPGLTSASSQGQILQDPQVTMITIKNHGVSLTTWGS